MSQPTPAQTRSARAATRPPHRESGQSVVEFALVLPIMLFVLMGILDFARIYTTMIAVESAAREAADYGTTLGAGKWQDGERAETERKMQQRACVATRDLPDYTDSDAAPENGCTNPSFAYCMTASAGGPCAAVDPTLAEPCEDPLRATPCTVTVTLTHDFRLLAPIGVDFYGLHFGFPTSITFQRDSTFAMTDIDLAVPGP